MATTLRVHGEVLAKAIPAPRYIDVRQLAAAASESWTVPDGIEFVLISANEDIYMRVANAAAVPAADISDGTGSMLLRTTYNPFPFRVESGTTLNFIRTGASSPIVTIACYSRSSQN